MSNPNLPDAVEKRDLIYGDDTTEEQLKDLGDQFFEADLLYDAVEAYTEGDIKEGGEKILERGIEEGNYFLIEKVNETWEDLVSDETWKEAGQAAEEQGRLTDAIKLYYTGGFNKDLERVEAQLEEEYGHSIPAVVRTDTADAKEKDELDEE